MNALIIVRRDANIVDTGFTFSLPVKSFLCLLILLMSALVSTAQLQDTVKMMSYNLLNYPSGSGYSADTTSRHPHYRTILQDVEPDILVVQEMLSETGVTGFCTSVLNANSILYAAAPFNNGPDTDNGLFYKVSKFHSVTNNIIDTELRDINEFKLVHTLSGDTLRIYSLHLKSSTGGANVAQRAREVDSLRKVTNALPFGTNFIVCGDFNLYGSTEPAYQKLLLDTGGNEGHFIDPITMTGTWNDPLYSIRHTQSPRVRALGDGGSTGGMDDRFDLVLYSQAISLNGGMKYINNSQIAYGNDGTLYNDSINHPSNTAVSPTIANALHNAADHIPVLSSFTFEYSTSSVPTDFGATALINPQTPMCGNANQSMAVQIKNHGGVSVDFATNPLDVFLQVTTPSAGILTFSETISSGNISGGTNLTVNFNALINMSASGTYSFRAYTVQVNDVNSLNDSLPPVSIVVSSTSNPTINPPGPQSICSGDSISLTASPGIAYLWSNGSTNPSITVMDTGNYSVQITIAGGCFATSSPVHVSHTLPPANGTVFVESMGTVAGTTTMATHEGNNGFDNDSYTMTGNADVRQTLASSGYLGSSGNANVFFTTAGRNFVIAGINTTGYTNLQLSHGIYKGAIAANGTELIVEISTNGIDFTPLTVPALPTGSGTASWHYRSITGVIPSVPALWIQFRHTSGTVQYRIDDILLSGTGGASQITADGPTSFCLGDSVVLSGGPGNNYLWNTGATTQDITVHSSGTYSVRIDCVPSADTNVVVSNCQSVTLNLKAYIQGFYIGNQTMIAVADPVNFPEICDTITVELSSASAPFGTVYAQTGVIDTSGLGSFVFPPATLNDSFYIVIKHRNSLETWSSVPVVFDNISTSYDFSTSAGKAFGNNLANMDGEFGLYSGDFTNGITPGVHDGVINELDFAGLESALGLFITGYSIYDLTGDRLVETSDFSLIESNLELGISVLKP